MPKVINAGLAGRVIGAAGGRLEFDADGVAVATPEQAALMSQIEGFEVVEDEKPKKVEASKAEAPKTDATKAAEPVADKKVTKKAAKE